MASTTDGHTDAGILLRGGVSGVAALLAGYAVTYAWKAPAVDDALGGVNAIAEILGGQAVPTWKAVGWLFLNAHLVATRVPGLGGERLVNFIDASDDGSLVLLYVLVPVLLLVAGAVVAGYRRRDGVAGGAIAGATIVVGYLPATVALALVAGHAFGGDVTIRPDLLTAVAVAGAMYPAVFGAAGGALRGWLGDRSR